MSAPSQRPLPRADSGRTPALAAALAAVAALLVLTAAAHRLRGRRRVAT